MNKKFVSRFLVIFRKKADVEILEQGSSCAEEFACIKCGKGFCSSNAKVVHVSLVHEDSLLASSCSDENSEIAKENVIADGTSDIFENVIKVELLRNVGCNVKHSGGDGVSKLGGDHNHYKDNGAIGGHDRPVQEEE